MNTAIVWILITISVSIPNQVVYSPPMVNIETYQHLEQNVHETNNKAGYLRTKCVQINMAVTK